MRGRICVLTLFALAGCRDASGPRPLHGEYELETVDGAPMPAAPYAAATLTLDADSLFCSSSA